MLALSVSYWPSPRQAATISYPDQGPIPPGYMFTNIVESSATDGVPLYGPPTAFPIGLDFTPSRLRRFEHWRRARPDRRPAELHGHGGTQHAGHSADSRAAKAARSRSSGRARRRRRCWRARSFRASVHEINGVPIAPINLTPVNGSVAFDLNSNPGVAQPWGLGLTLNVSAQLAGLGFARRNVQPRSTSSSTMSLRR